MTRESDERRVVARPETIYDVLGNAATRSSSFDPATSPLYRQLGFVVGAPRSGTTWLQQMLLVHPMIVTGGESHIFCEGLPEVFQNFAYPPPMSHLSTWVSEQELVAAARGFCDAIFEAQRAARPDARVIVEKTPNHMMQSALQARIYPDAHYVHIVRDGRDSTSSQRQLWAGRMDAYAHPGRMAARWADEIGDIRTHFRPLHFMEIRYEDVVGDPPGALAAIFDHFELPHDTELCEAAAAFGKAPVNTAPSATEVGVRKHKGDLLAERSVARAAGDLLVELGYADAAEVQRLRNLRSTATVIGDARDGVASLWTRANAKANELRTRLRQRRKRNAERPIRLVASAVSEAITSSEAAGLVPHLAPGVVVGGSAYADAAAAAAAVVAKLGGSRITSNRVADGFAQQTAIRGEDRVIVRIKVERGQAVSIDFL